MKGCRKIQTIFLTYGINLRFTEKKIVALLYKRNPREGSQISSKIMKFFLKNLAQKANQEEQALSRT